MEFIKMPMLFLVAGFTFLYGVSGATSRILNIIILIVILGGITSVFGPALIPTLFFGYIIYKLLEKVVEKAPDGMSSVINGLLIVLGIFFIGAAGGWLVNYFDLNHTHNN
jgi:4-hydroxybenzoate polyprenyltransferase